MENLKNSVKNYLEESGISKTKFCQRIGITPSYLYKWFNGESKYSDELIERIKIYLEKYSIGSAIK